MKEAKEERNLNPVVCKKLRARLALHCTKELSTVHSKLIPGAAPTH
jgi:hypothetical protein